MDLPGFLPPGLFLLPPPPGVAVVPVSTGVAVRGGKVQTLSPVHYTAGCLYPLSKMGFAEWFFPHIHTLRLHAVLRGIGALSEDGLFPVLRVLLRLVLFFLALCP